MEDRGKCILFALRHVFALRGSYFHGEIRNIIIVFFFKGSLI